MQFNVFSGANVLFRNNSAEIGGALQVNNPSIGQDLLSLFNVHCFIQYEIERDDSKTIAPDDWNVRYTDTYTHDCVYNGNINLLAK